MSVVPSSFHSDGYAIISGVLDPFAVNELVKCVQAKKPSGSRTMGSAAVYAIRCAFREVPDLERVLLDSGFRSIVHVILGRAAFVTKSIWFEKPPGGNWFVGWHQDISISVARRIDVPGYSRWTAKHGVIGVVPALSVLQRTLTVRIHLDDADAENGAVRVIPGSHRQGITPPPAPGTEGVLCSVPAGGVMLMRPLLMHASARSRSKRPRRVLHIELNDMELDGGLEWAERITLPG